MNAITRTAADIIALAPPAALKQIAAEAGTALAKDAVVRIKSGEITIYDPEALSAQLAKFVFDSCSDMRADGHGELDVMLFRDACVNSFRVTWSAFRVELTASTEQVLQ